MSRTALSARAQEMHAVMQTYQESGLTQQQFCHQQHLPRSTFQYWWHHFRKHTQNQPEGHSSGFISVNVETSSPLSCGCRITFPNGICIDFNGTVDPRMLLTLVNGG